MTDCSSWHLDKSAGYNSLDLSDNNLIQEPKQDIYGVPVNKIDHLLADPLRVDTFCVYDCSFSWVQSIYVVMNSQWISFHILGGRFWFSIDSIDHLI